MRSSVIGWYAKDLKELKKLVYKAIVPTHNEQEAIKASEIVAIAIFLFENNYNKEHRLIADAISFGNYGKAGDTNV